MRPKPLTDSDIRDIDACASQMEAIPGVRQVFAGHRGAFERLPEPGPDGSLTILIDVDGDFVAKCFKTFRVEKRPHAYGPAKKPDQAPAPVSARERIAFARRSLLRVKISKVGSLLRSKYRVTLQLCVAESVLTFAEYETGSAEDIFAVARDALN